jgi:hypothetical protein
MSEKPSVLSTIAPQPQPAAEGEYELICATMAESARGRWFLDEYARRNRNTDTAQVLAAIERIEAMIRGERGQQGHQSFRGDLLEMAKAVAQTRAEVAAIEREAPAAARAREALHYLEWRISAMLDSCAEPARALLEQAPQEQVVQEQALQEQAPAVEGAVDQQSTDQISTGDPSTYETSAEEAVEAVEAVEPANAAPVTAAAVPPPESPVPIPDEPSPPIRAAIPEFELEPLVVVPLAWRKTPTDEPQAPLEHAPIPVEPLFPEKRADEQPAAAATASALFKPPEAALVFLVEYPTPAAQDAPTEAAMLDTASVPERLAPVAAPEASVERLAVMIADIDKEPPVPDTAAPAPQPHALSSNAVSSNILPIAEPIPRPLPEPEPVAPPAAAAASATRDPLAALRALSPEERIALFT